MRRRIQATSVLLAMAVLLAACATAADEPADDAAIATDDEAPTDEDAAAPEAGNPAPSLELETFDGETVTLEDFRGQPMVVNFWASWCPPCIAEMPYIESVHQDLADEVVFLGINTQDSLEPALDLVEQTGVTYELILDPSGDAFRAFEVFTMPSTFFIDRAGHIVDRHGGILTEDQLREQIEESLAVS